MIKHENKNEMEKKLEEKSISFGLFFIIIFHVIQIQYFTQFGHMAKLSESEFVLQ
jgi:hypothetical protein